MRQSVARATREPLQKSADRDIPAAERTTDARPFPAGIARVLFAGTLLIPLVIAPGEDTFRFPKDLALRAETILVGALVILAAIFGRFSLSKRPLRETWVRMLLLICAWAALTTALSTNVALSAHALVRILEYAFLFATAVYALRRTGVLAAALVIPAALINAVIYLLQSSGIWNPFPAPPGIEKHLMQTALVGNPNDVGSYLVVPALTAMALALTQRRAKAAWWAAAALLTIATLATQTVTAIGALGIGVIVLLAMRLRSRKKIVAACLAAIVGTAVAFTVYRPLRERATGVIRAARQGDLETLSAARVIPFITAVEMIRDHPLTGVGPGCYSFHFFDYKLKAQATHRWLFGPHMTAYNFGEVHSDHLQILAESGIAGYALFIAALAAIASRSWRRRLRSEPAPDERSEFVIAISAPLAIAFAVLAVAQFPLELVAPCSTFLWVSAALVAWSPRP